MKKIWLFLGAVVAVLYKILKFLYRFFTKHLINGIMGIGLYVPGTYLLYAILLKAIVGLDLKVIEQRNLFFVGLAVSVLCSVVIGIRNYVIKPLRRTDSRPTPLASRRGRRDVVDLPEPRQVTPDRPLIYRSRIYPDVTVYEFRDRFDLYKHVNGELRLVGVEYKD